MTMQVPDAITIEGKKWWLAGDPLSDVLPEWPDVPQFVAPTTANWRGYEARWRVTKGLLYLSGITAHVELASGQLLEVTGGSALGGRRLPMRASFVSGQWRVSRGKASYGRDFYAFGEEQRLMVVDAGRVTFEPWMHP